MPRLPDERSKGRDVKGYVLVNRDAMVFAVVDTGNRTDTGFTVIEVDSSYPEKLNASSRDFRRLRETRDAEV